MAREHTAAASDVPRPQPGLGTFRALRYRHFRLLWFGQIGTSASLWMEQVIRPLLMLHLTGSALQVGNIIAARMVPQLAFGLLAGAVADRYNKRLVLMASQAVTMFMHLALGLLVVTDQVHEWHVYATAVVAGGANAFMQPTRQSIIPRLVPRDALLNALALNTAATNIMRVAGAGLAGMLLIPFDFGEVYFANAALFLGVVWTTVQMRIPDTATPAASVRTPALSPENLRSSSLFDDLLEGIRYMQANPRVLVLIGAALILFMFGQPYQQVFVPLIVVDVLHEDRSVVGLTLAVSGIGALAGSLTVATKGSIARRGAVMLVALTLLGLSLVLFAQSDWLWLSMLAILVTGAMTVTYLALNSSLLLEQTPQELQGRVVSFMSLDRGLMSLGAVLGGALAEWYGPTAGLTIMGAACAGLALLVFSLVTSVRRMR